MNLSLTTSFIIAGILLLSIASINHNISKSSTELTMRQITQQKTRNITDVLQHDIQNLGYNVEDAPIILEHNLNKIVFKSDIYNDGCDDDCEEITWWFNKSGDKTLIREIVSEEDPLVITSGVEEFEIGYLNSEYAPVLEPQAYPDSIKHIQISMTIISPEPIGGRGGNSNYLETSWNKTFTPFNLK